MGLSMEKETKLKGMTPLFSAETWETARSQTASGDVFDPVVGVEQVSVDLNGYRGGG